MSINESPLPGQELAYVDFEQTVAEPYERPSTVVEIDEANLLTSRVAVKPTDTINFFTEDMHKVVIDLDLPAQLIHSSTPGHHHLIIDHEIPWSAYVRLLDTLAECGLVEGGFVSASKERGYTAVRLPWVKKRGTDVSEKC